MRFYLHIIFKSLPFITCCIFLYIFAKIFFTARKLESVAKQHKQLQQELKSLLPELHHKLSIKDTPINPVVIYYDSTFSREKKPTNEKNRTIRKQSDSADASAANIQKINKPSNTASDTITLALRFWRYKGNNKEKIRVNRYCNIDKINLHIELKAQSNMESIYISSASLYLEQTVIKDNHQSISTYKVESYFKEGKIICIFKEVLDGRQEMSDVNPLNNQVERTFVFEGAIIDNNNLIKGVLTWRDLADDNYSFHRIRTTMELNQVTSL